MRRTHILRPNAAGYQPTLRVYLDTESTHETLPDGTDRQRLWFGWLCYERVRLSRGKPLTTTEWQRFTTADELWDYLESRTQEHRTLYCYAHNWDYDGALISMDSESKEREWTCERYIRSSHFIMARFVRGHRRIAFIDTLNYYPMPLATVGEALQEPKLPMPTSTDDRDAWDAYCRQDVRVIVSAMRTFWQTVHDYDLGKAMLTTPSQALAAFRHRFMGERILILADDAVSALERRAYHGGRTEVFYDRPLTTPVYCLDVNSMYPAVMADAEYPSWKIGKGKSASLSVLAQKLERECVIADVLLSTDAPCYPYYDGKRLVFPTGTFRAVLTTPELRLALDRGDVRDVGAWVSYLKAPLFRRYVEELYALRLSLKAAGNRPLELVVKLLLNGLYGKFGQSGRVWEPCPEDYDDAGGDFYATCTPGHGPLLHHARFELLQHLLVAGESNDSFPAIAAHVTAEARVRLWHLRETAGPEHVYYVDTDSLMVDAEGLRRLATLLHPTDLGMLKLEREAPEAWFRAAKDYTFGEMRKLKGVRSRARETAPDAWSQEQFRSYDQMLARGLDGVVDVLPITKHVSHIDRKSIGTPSGWREPIRLERAEPGESP